jgi:hypothetical protein
MRARRFGPLLGLYTTLLPVAWLYYLALAAVAAVLAAWLAQLGLGAALLAGVLSALVFFVSEWLHQFGHSLAARWVGRPMLGMKFFSLFSASVYPADEPPLPAGLHVRRALGGFWVNLALGLLCLPAAIALYPRGGEILPAGPTLAGWVAAFGAVTNLVVLGAGSLVPLKIPGGGYNDGGTVLHYWREAQGAKPGA